MAESRVGMWLIGAKGGVATTAILGLATLKQGRSDAMGLVTALPRFRKSPFPAWDSLVVGGHEIRATSLPDEAAAVAKESRIPDPGVLDGVRGELEMIDARIRPGTLLGVGKTIVALADDDRVPREETPSQAIARLRGDLEAFARDNGLGHVVVVNVASTEPPADTAALPPTWAELERQLDTALLPASSLYAVAAFQAGCSYVNFTPSLGSTPAALDELARQSGVCHMGCDGKTGETLLKSVLAPAFAQRNLQVMSWVGHNIFGNMDSRVLDDPANKRAKVASKDHLLREILGYPLQTLVSIEMIESLGDWKTAWDHVHFSGFLGVPMTFQFIWQGCDSVLAAPLVLDLVRLTDLARRRSHVGSMPFLASFFKSPQGVDQHSFDRQFRMLEDWLDVASAIK